MAGVFGLAGFAALSVGLWWVYPASALIVGGVLLLAGAARIVNGAKV